MWSLLPGDMIYARQDHDNIEFLAIVIGVEKLTLVSPPGDFRYRWKRRTIRLQIVIDDFVYSPKLDSYDQVNYTTRLTSDAHVVRDGEGIFP